MSHRGGLFESTLVEAGTWGAGLAILYLMGWALGVGIVDDAYIFARFAENLADGNGLRFNPGGETVEGFTSPAWVGLLALWRSVGGDAPAGARWIGVLMAAYAVWLVGRTARRESLVGRALVVGLLASSPILAHWSGSGMDAALFGVAAVVTGRALLREPFSPWLAGLAVGAAAWVRPEAFFVWTPWMCMAAFFLAGDTRRGVRAALLLLGAALVAVLPQVALRWYTLHEWLPNTFYAKASLGMADRLRHGGSYLVRQIPAMLGFIVVGVASLRSLLARRDRAGMLLLAGVGVWLGYVLAIGGDHFALARFLIPALAFTALAAVRAYDRAPDPWRRKLRIALLAGVALSLASSWTPEARRARNDVELTRTWLAVGGALRNEFPRGTRIATIVAGAIPYASGFDTFDMLGLVTRSVAREGKSYPRGKPGHERYNTDALVAFAPDVIVYPTSGRFPDPQWRDPEKIDKRYCYALYDAVRDPRIGAAYVAYVGRLDDGTCLELLVRAEVRATASPALLRNTR